MILGLSRRHDHLKADFRAYAYDSDGYLVPVGTLLGIFLGESKGTGWKLAGDTAKSSGVLHDIKTN